MKASKQPDYTQFLRVLRRDGKPDHLPFYEHIASDGFISRRIGMDINTLPWGSEAYWKAYIDFWMGMGFDCVPMEIGFNIPYSESEFGCGPEAVDHETSSVGSEAGIRIRNWDDYEKLPWPDESAPIDFSHFEIVGKLLPEGAKIVGGVCAGPYEWTSSFLGTEGMSYLLADDPELVEMVFARFGRLHVSAFRQLATMDSICALRQGDDLGFKTSTFLSPQLLRKLVFPTYRAMVDAAHTNDKPFILHSCGNLAEVYDDLIDDCGIDAKHSFEDTILPVSEFKRVYGDRVTPLGGLDVDTICRASEDELRKYARKSVEECFYDGFWAMGSGNSLTNYMPVENYLMVLEEALAITS